MSVYSRSPPDRLGLFGLSQPGNVSLYQRRYADMPRPAVNPGCDRCMLWLRPEMEQWANNLAVSGRDPT